MLIEHLNRPSSPQVLTLVQQIAPSSLGFHFCVQRYPERRFPFSVSGFNPLIFHHVELFSVLPSCLLRDERVMLLQAANLVVYKNRLIVLTQNSMKNKKKEKKKGHPITNRSEGMWGTNEHMGIC